MLQSMHIERMQPSFKSKARIPIYAVLHQHSVLGILYKHSVGKHVRLSFIPLFLILLPLIEIAGFVVVGREIGVLPTIGLILATGIAGGMLLRHQGFGVMSRIRSEVEAGRDPSRNLAHGVMILLAGLLLLIPGFVTDIVGILLFLPTIRDLGWRFLQRRVNFATNVAGMGGFSRPHGKQDRTIDLEEGDYTKSADPNSPWRRIDDR